MEDILPSISASHPHVTLRITGQLAEKKHKSNVLLVVTDIRGCAKRLGEDLRAALKGCNSWYIDELGRLAIMLGTYENTSALSRLNSGNDDMIYVDEDEWTRRRVEGIIQQEVKNMSQDNQPFLDLICEEFEVSEE